MTRLWMVRGEGGALYDRFRDQKVVAIGWRDLAAVATPGVSRSKLLEVYKETRARLPLHSQ